MQKAIEENARVLRAKETQMEEPERAVQLAQANALKRVEKYRNAIQSSTEKVKRTQAPRSLSRPSPRALSKGEEIYALFSPTVQTRQGFRKVVEKVLPHQATLVFDHRRGTLEIQTSDKTNVVSNKTKVRPTTQRLRRSH